VCETRAAVRNIAAHDALRSGPVRISNQSSPDGHRVMHAVIRHQAVTPFGFSHHVYG
jgi:hypothetical protein